MGTNTDVKNSLDIVVANGLKEGINNYELQLDHRALNDHKNPEILASLLHYQYIYGCKYSGHAPYRKVDLASKDDLKRYNSIEQVLETLPFFSALDVKTVTVHTGRENPSAEHNLLSSLDFLVKKSQQYGIDIALETAGREECFFTPTPEIYKEFSEKTGCKLTLDLIHLLWLYRSRFFDVLKKLLPYCVNIHIGDSYESRHQHHPLGYGTFPFVELLELLQNSNYSGQITADSMDGRFSSELYLRQAVKFKTYFSDFLI